MGLLLPPCLPLILYAIVAKVPIQDIFLGGVIPGIVMMVAVSWWGIRQGRQSGVERQPFEWVKAKQAVWEAKWELMLPVVTFAALFGGIATPVEAAAVTALYAFVAEAIIHRDLTFGRDVPRVMVEAGLVIGGVLLILGVALGLTDYLIDADITARAVEYAHKPPSRFTHPVRGAQATREAFGVEGAGRARHAEAFGKFCALAQRAIPFRSDACRAF